LLLLLLLLLREFHPGLLILFVAIERLLGRIVYFEQQLVSLDFEIIQQTKSSQSALLIFEANEAEGTRGVADWIHHALPMRDLATLLQQALGEFIARACWNLADVDGGFDAKDLGWR
jgi:hypothetical protein